jgi:Mg-chelatase subunit ChlD
LVVIGGPNSYGVGGYFQTPLEEVLPVEMRIKDQKRVPRLLMVYVIDRSGSMEEIGPSGVTNLELAKEATRRSFNFLFSQDRAGVLSFDSNPQWLVPIQQVADRQRITQLVGQLRPGGGTDIYSAVREIARTVPSDPSTLKHVILLTDGGADPTGIVDTVKEMHDKHGITVTSIGIGGNVPSFMRDISLAGKGAYYQLVDLQTIPQIFAQETVLATRSYIVENEFTPGVVGISQIMQGITTMPSLLGYVATTAKPTSTVILRAPGFDDPLLASWQYGLGRAVAWTSDATSRWSKNWTSWNNFGRFWSQVIRSTITEGTNNSLESHVEQRNGKSVLVVEARDDRGGFINGLDLSASITDPRLEPKLIDLRQVAPGRYEAEFDPQREGAYLIRLAGATVGAGGGNTPSLAVAQTTGWVLSYSPEYRLRETNFNLLDEMTRLTGGSNITEKPELAFSHTIREARSATSLWPWLLLAVTILLPLDIAVRRVVITRSDMAKASAWISDKLGLRREAPVLTRSGQMSRLMGAKERAVSSPPPGTSLPTMPSSSTSTTTAPRSAPSESAAHAQSGPIAARSVLAAKKEAAARAAVKTQVSSPTMPPTPPPSHAAPAAPPRPAPSNPVAASSEDDSGNLASRLLDKRRKRDD